MPKILCFTPLPTHPEVTFYSIDDETFESKLKVLLIDKNTDLPRKNVKAVIFRFTKAEQKDASKLAQMLEDYYSKYKIPFYCCSWNSFYLSAIMLAAVDEYSDGILKNEMNFLICEDGCLKYFKLCKVGNQYQTMWLNRLPNDGDLAFTLTLVEPITNLLVTCSNSLPEIQPPKKSDEMNDFAFRCSKMMAAFQSSNNLENPTPIEAQKKIIEIVGEKNVTVINKDISNYLSKAIVLKALSLLGEKSFKYGVANTGFKNYALSTAKVMLERVNISSKREKMEQFIIKILLSDIVPVKKTVVYYKAMDQLMLIGPEGMEASTCDQHFDAGTTLRFSLDKHFLFNSYIKKDNIYNKNAAFICLKDDTISMDLVRNGKLEKNVLHRIPVAVSFIDGNVQVGEEAMKLKECHNSYVITDLIEIMSTDFEELQIDLSWGFTVYKNKDEIFIEFDTFRGRRKAATAFLFAVILKWFIKKAEANFGHIVVIVSKDMNENLEKQLKNSFKNTKLQLADFQIQYHKLIEINE